jgi:cobalt-zinc-cadmium efflux system membrane fusion protein
MNKQLLLIPILIGIALIAGGRIQAVQPPQPSLEIAGGAPDFSPKDKDEDADGGSTEKEGKQPISGPKDRDQDKDGDKSVTAKAVKEPDSGPKEINERESGEKNITEKGSKEPNEVGRVDLNEKKVENANLDVEVAGPAKIKATLQLYGKITLNEDTVANVSPRYPGVVKAVSKRLGDRVQKGEVLAVIESNDSLRDYQVISQISGTIIKKAVTVGEVVRDDRPIFTVADLSTVWVDFSVFPHDFRRLKEGQVVQINYADNIIATTGKITYIAPFGSENTQSMVARAVVQNLDGLLRPGLFVTAELQIEEIDVPVAVRPAAIQSVNEKTVVFVVEGTAFEAREVELGTRDESYVEVMSGLTAGDRYVAGNSFLLKAELGKGQVQDSD